MSAEPRPRDDAGQPADDASREPAADVPVPTPSLTLDDGASISLELVAEGMVRL